MTPGAGAPLQGVRRGEARARGEGDRWTHLLLLLVIEVVPFAYDGGQRHVRRCRRSGRNALRVVRPAVVNPISKLTYFQILCTPHREIAFTGGGLHSEDRFKPSAFSAIPLGKTHDQVDLANRTGFEASYFRSPASGAPVFRLRCLYVPSVGCRLGDLLALTRDYPRPSAASNT